MITQYIFLGIYCLMFVAGIAGGFLAGKFQPSGKKSTSFRFLPVLGATLMMTFC